MKEKGNVLWKLFITCFIISSCTFGGGAVLNEEYVEFVGADYYGKDAGMTVKIANEVFGHNN